MSAHASIPRILVADREGPSTELLLDTLREAELYADLAGEGEELAARIQGESWDVLLADTERADLDALADQLDREDAPSVILMSGFGTPEEAARALEEGAFDYLAKPLSGEQVLFAVLRALEHRDLQAENQRLRAEAEARFELGRVLSRDPAMEHVFETVRAVADTPATLLISGESGTGKSMLARTVHQCSSRADGPFIVVNCGALAGSLLESELFGHGRGAFTGAVADKAGKFEAASGGTLFLDEIACAPPDLQVKLLRVLQEKVFERVGENRTRTSDARVIVATNRDLRAEVEAGRFREDLFYRVNVVAVEVPPLRERRGDIPLLAELFRARFAREYERPVKRVSGAAAAALSAWDWPGNVRELEHVLERAVLLCGRDELEVADLPPELLKGGDGDLSGAGADAVVPDFLPGETLPLRVALEGPEREILRRALAANAGNRKETARMLDINRSTLFNKMKKYKLM